ncbi:hypothetical protein [Loktanella salsilacus]|uniref:hypothetical protein n=1 Tax=Loktanella salsilacus TaxID=195913 RepID=UPI003736DF9C
MTEKSKIIDFVRIEIHHANGIEAFDANTIIMTCFNTPEQISNLVSPGNPSFLSGQPALLYKTFQFETWLTHEEIYRMTMRNLNPAEALKLLELYGPVFEIHSDFYDDSTGEALQPKYPDYLSLSL